MSGNIIVSFLLAIGMTFLLWLLYKWLRESLSKKGFKEENERLVFFFVCGVTCFFVNYLWLVPQVITGDVVKNVVDQQYENCKETNDLTNEQCQYFQDVLNGKYNESEQKININALLDK